MSISETFQSVFGHAPQAETVTPGRVNLIGEHIDYNGGTVLPAAIARHIAIALGPSPDDRDHIYSANFNETQAHAPDELKSGRWSDYAAGALQISRADRIISGGVDVAINSTIPAGAGLSSSAALTVGLIAALHKMAATTPAVETLARMAQRVENDFIGVPCGIMDQMAVAAAPTGHALALDTRDLSFEAIALPTNYHFAVVHSGISRKLDEGRYAERRSECEQAARQLGASYLCHLSRTQAENIDKLPEPLNRRARHAYTEQRRVEQAVHALKHGDIGAVAEILKTGHASLRDDFDVSLPAIDQLVQDAETAGATGARLTGGGFGGCIVACVETSRLDDWTAEMNRLAPQATVLG